MCLHQLIWHVGIRTRRWLHSLASLHIKLAQYPLYLPDIYSRTKPRNRPTSWPQTYCYLSMATSLSSQYPTVVIEFCPQTLKRTSEREKINPWLLNHSSWPRSWTILYFFCPGTKCAKDIIWIYHKINCFFLKTEVSLKRLVGWIEFI